VATTMADGRPVTIIRDIGEENDDGDSGDVVVKAAQQEEEEAMITDMVAKADRMLLERSFMELSL
jgi:hypothetical protein